MLCVGHGCCCICNVFIIVQNYFQATAETDFHDCHFQATFFFTTPVDFPTIMTYSLSTDLTYLVQKNKTATLTLNNRY